MYPKKSKLKARLRAVAVAAALTIGAVTPAAADPFSLIVFVAQAALNYGWIVASTALWIQGAAIIGGALYNSRRQKKLRDQARDSHNASLKDVGIVTISTDPDVRELYGPITIGGYVVASFASDKVKFKKHSPGTYVRKDAYKHLVIALGRGPIEAIDDILIGGESIGTLDGSGYTTEGKYHVSGDGATQVLISETGYVDLPHVATEILGAVAQFVDSDGQQTAVTATITMSGTRIEAPAGSSVSYKYVGAQGFIKVTKYLGSDSQTADAYLMSVTAKWTSNHRGLGWAYLVITLDLEHEDFQAGLPDFTFKIRGCKLYDPRLDSTNGGSGAHRYATPSTWTYSTNAALATTRHLMSDLGFKVNPATDINWPSVILAANESDVTTIPFYRDEDDVLTEDDPIAKFTVSGVVSSYDSAEQVLENMCDTMSGFAVYGADWSIHTGTWHTPVDTLGDDDLHGEVSILQSGTEYEELFNGVKGTFILDGESTPADLVPYKNSTYVTADGEPLWTNVTYPFTNNRWRAAHMNRVKLEQNRLGLVIQYPAKLSKWPLAVGDRLLINNAEYAYVDKPFIVMDWQFDILTPVGLTLAEDQAETYDEEDETQSVARNSPQLPDPGVVAPIEGLLLETGTDITGIATDGTAIPRIKVSWSLTEDRYAMNGGHVELTWSQIGSSTSQTIQTPADTTTTFLSGVKSGTEVVVEVRLWNGYTHSSSVYAKIRVIGDTIPPGPVEEFGVIGLPGTLLFSWRHPSDYDYASTVLQLHIDGDVDTLWDDTLKPFFDGDATQRLMPWPGDGVYAVLARHKDHSGNSSEYTVRVLFEIDGQKIVSIAREWIATGDVEPEWLYSITDPESELIIGYAPSHWVGTADETILVDTPQIEDEAATTVVPGTLASTAYTFTNVSGVDQRNDHVMQTITWTNDTTKTVKGELSGEIVGKRDSGAASCHMAITQSSSSPTDSTVTDIAGPIKETYIQDYVRYTYFDTVTLTPGQTVYLTIWSIIRAAVGQAAQASIEGRLRITAIKV